MNVLADVVLTPAYSTSQIRDGQVHCDFLSNSTTVNHKCKLRKCRHQPKPSLRAGDTLKTIAVERVAGLLLLLRECGRPEGRAAKRSSATRHRAGAT